MNQNYIIFGLLFVLILILIQKKENFSDNHVNYPFDAYPDQFGTGNKFLDKLPYDNLTTRHYKKIYYNKTTPQCVKEGKCFKSPGYYKSYPDYFEDPQKLKSYYLGYSINGYPYNDYKFDSTESQKAMNVREPNHRFDYPEWFDYEKPQKASFYYGYPFYFGGKKFN